MSTEAGDLLVQVLMMTLALMLGWFAGSAERRADRSVIDHVEWDDHVQQALFVARRTP